MKLPLAFLFTKDALPDHVPNRSILAYASGLAGQNLTYWYITNWFFTFCNDILKIDANSVGWITGLTRLWDAINDPLIGAFIDRRRCKSGEKFRPYLLKVPPFIGIISALLFFNFGFSTLTATIYICVLYIIWDSLYSVQDVALWAMISISSPISQERARVAQWAQIGAGVGGAVIGLFPVLKGENVLNSLGVSEGFMYAVGGVVFAFLGEIIAMLAYNMKERVMPEPSAEKESFLQAIFVLRHNKTLLLISLARFLGFICISVPQIHFFESSVSLTMGGTYIDGGTMQMLYGALTMIPTTIATLSAVKLSNKLGGMKRMLIITEILNITLRIVSYFIGFNSMPQMIAVMAVMSIANIKEGVKDIAFRSITSDSIDAVEVKTGQRTEGISFSMQNFITKLGNAAALIINGQLLTYLGYDQHLENKRIQNAKYLKWQWPMFIIGPLVGAFLYLFVLFFVDDDKEQKKRIENELRRRRAERTEPELAVRV